MFLFMILIKSAKKNKDNFTNEKAFVTNNMSRYVNDDEICSFHDISISSIDKSDDSITDFCNKNAVSNILEKNTQNPINDSFFFENQRDAIEFAYDEYITTFSFSTDDDNGFNVQKIEIKLFCNQKQLMLCLKKYENSSKDIAIDQQFLMILLNSRYQCFNFIDQGCSGKVFKACNTKTGEKVAIKIIHCGKNRNLFLHNELLIYSNLQHKNMVKFHEAFAYMNILILIMEFVQFSLYNCPFLLIDNQKISLQLIDVVEFLHERGIVHNDIIRKNILIDNESNIRLVDFGEAKINHETQMLFSNTLSSYRIEKLNKTTYDPKLDIIETEKIATIIRRIYVDHYEMKMQTDPNLNSIVYEEFSDEENPYCNGYFQNIESKTLAKILYDCMLQKSNCGCSLFELRERMIDFFKNEEIQMQPS